MFEVSFSKRQSRPIEFVIKQAAEADPGEGLRGLQPPL